MMNAPIVLFVYNRPEHTRRTLEALRQAEGASESSLYIFSDGAGQGQDKKVEEVRLIIKNAEGFGKVSVTEREKNIGLAQNIITGVSEVLERHERVIVLEDDLIVSPSFLTYMNAALDYYESMGVFSISGYSPDIDIPEDYMWSTYMIHRNCSWGWATWRSKWQSVDWDVKDFGTFIKDGEVRNRFDQSGSDLSSMLLRQQMGEIKSWSIRFCYCGFRLGEPTVYPVRSLVSNGGVDGSGTHMKSYSGRKYKTELADKIDSNVFLNRVDINAKILSSFKKKYDCSIIRRIINCCKRLRYKILK